MTANAPTLKQKAHELIDQLPDDATWGDVAYRAAVRADIEAGLADSAAGRVTPVEDILKELGLADA
jgi:predicted transcriptional regulator